MALEVNAAIAKAAEEDAAEEAARIATRDEPFEADIVGPFSGWGGKTVFTLSNGQVWRQRTGSNYRHTADGQTVAVKKELYGVMDADGDCPPAARGGLPDRLKCDPRPASGDELATVFLRKVPALDS